MEKKKIFVIGCGRWGTFIAWYLDSISHTVSLYGRENSQKMKELFRTRNNGLIDLAKTVSLTSDLSLCKQSDILIISVPSQSLSSLAFSLSELGIVNKTVVLCMKGIDIASGKRLSEIAEDFLGKDNKIAVWLGPGHVEQFSRGKPGCMVIDSSDEQTKQMLVESFSSPLIRFYYGNDLIGNEIGAAAKNVIGIAAGMLDGLGVSSLKGALIARAPREIARLVSALGGNPMSVYGLSHLGDYEATVFSCYSHNRRFGEAFVLGEKCEELAEGYYTVEALMKLSERLGAELPICRAVYNAVYCGADVKSEIESLFSRSLKGEFE